MINTTVELLTRIMMFCGQQGVELQIKNNGDKNSFEIIYEPVKQFIITIVDNTDENIPNQLSEKFMELQQLFQ